MDKNKFQYHSINLSTQIKRAIGSRILICFILAMSAILMITANEIIAGSHQLTKSLDGQCSDLASFVISQMIVKNEDSIRPKLAELNKSTNSIKFTWINEKNTTWQKQLRWDFPFSWKYFYPIKYIDGTNRGAFVVTGSVFHDHVLLPDLLTNILLLILSFIIIFVVLYPLGKRIPQQLFIAPIDNLLQLLRNGTNKMAVDGLLAVPNEIIEIREKITVLLQDAEDRSREVTLGQIATQVAHDIRSPLTALDMVMKDIVGIQENQRILIRNATNRIRDIANNLLSCHKKYLSHDESIDNNQEWIADLILTTISEKRAQYQNTPIEFVVEIQESTYDVFSNLSSSAFRRVLSNLLNNAVESMRDIQNEIVKVILTAQSDLLTVTIQDHGCGIPADLLKNIVAGKVNTQKEDGHGLGLSYAIKMIEDVWKGQFIIQSRINEGTVIDIILPRVAVPLWFAAKLLISSKTTIVILDDDEAIHQVWRNRFNVYLTATVLIEFYSPNELIEWMRGPVPRDVIFLIDYEFIGSTTTGIDILKKIDAPAQSFLVTSRYEELNIRDHCERLAVRIIPKNYATYIPIQYLPEVGLQPDLIFIDDDGDLTDAWLLRGEMLNKKIDIFNNANDFLRVKNNYYRNIPVYIDSDLGDGMSGQDFAMALHKEGFINIYLSTGYEANNFGKMPWIKAIVGKEPPF